MNQAIETKLGFKMFVDPCDQVISRSIKKHGFYDRKGSAIIGNALKKEDIFVDVGAHIGYFSFIAASKIGNKGHVFAFEPAPANFHFLLRNINLNKLQNIMAIQKAILEKKKRVQLFLSEMNTGDHRVFDSDDHRKFIEIEAINLDDFFDKQNERIDFIKIDVQGSEVKVLEGMKEILKKKKLKIFIEFWPYGIKMNGDDPKRLLNLILENGFKIIFPIMRTRKFLNRYTPENKKYINLFCVKGY